jgi:hypothetical protein
MAKVRTTVTLDDEVLKWVKVRAARLGVADSQVIEESLRRDLGLALMERLWGGDQMSEDEARRLAVEAQHATRRRHRRR